MRTTRSSGKSGLAKAAGLGAVGVAAAASDAYAGNIDIGFSAQDASSGAFGSTAPYGTTSTIETYDNPGVSPGYDAGFDNLLNDTISMIPGADSEHVFCVYSPVGGIPKTNLDHNFVPVFQNGDNYTMHFGLRDGIGGGAHVNLDIQLLSLNVDPNTEVAYNFTMDTDGNGTPNVVLSGDNIVADVGIGNSIWQGTAYIPAGVDVRTTSTSTGYSSHFGELNLQTSSVPEPSGLASLLIGGGVGALFLAKKLFKK